MYVICAPDSFKGTLTAHEVAEAMAAGVREAGGVPITMPLADGGEGTAAVLAEALDAQPVTVRVHDPLGRLIDAEWFRHDDTAIVEMARASGLPLVDEAERDAMRASTFGTGELIADALKAGCTTVLITVGGSATTDGGAGAIDALKAAGFTDENIADDVSLRVLTDVTTSFVDAASIFGPQKGADQDDVSALEDRLNKLAEQWSVAHDRDPRDVPRTGAGGGISGGLWAVYGASLESGIDTVLDLVGFDEAVTRAIVGGRGTGGARILTGEGRFDGQTPKGKVVAGVAGRARDVPVIVIAGSTGDGADDAAQQLSLSDLVVASTADEICQAARDAVAPATLS